MPKHAGPNWVPLLGTFNITNDEIRFLGKRVPVQPSNEPTGQEPVDHPSMGLLVCNQSLADGSLAADVQFGRVTPDTLCELAVSYDPNGYQLVTAGLGGEPLAMFSIREYALSRTQGKGWWNHRVGGDRGALKQGRTYHLEAVFRGTILTLKIDDVLVGSAEVSTPKGMARQAGLLFRGDHQITVRHFSVDAVKPKAFVVMQFGADYEDVYRDVVKEVCRDYEVSASRADELAGPGLIIADIVREITTAQLLLADISAPNSNVFFEVGYGLAVGKPIVLLARKGTALPFDVAGFRVLFYEDSIGGKKKLEEGLRRHLDAILGP